MFALLWERTCIHVCVDFEPNYSVYVCISTKAMYRRDEERRRVGYRFEEIGDEERLY